MKIINGKIKFCCVKSMEQNEYTDTFVVSNEGINIAKYYGEYNEQLVVLYNIKYCPFCGAETEIIKE